MKSMTCKQLGGPCDLVLRGATANDVIKAQDQHLKDMVAGGDETHQPRADRDERPLEEPGRRHGLVPQGQARFRRASSRLNRVAPYRASADKRHYVNRTKRSHSSRSGGPGRPAPAGPSR